MTTISEVKTALNVAARARQQYGATPAQINYICSLLENGANENDLYFAARTTTLTKDQASAWIDRILNPVEIPAFDQDAYDRRQQEISKAGEEYADHEARKDAWIKENYPDYDSLPSQKRKKIRHAANKAVAQ